MSSVSINVDYQTAHWSILDILPDLIWITTPNKNTLFFNAGAGAYFGTDTDLTNWMSAIHPEDQSNLSEAWLSSLSGVRPLSETCRIADASGNYAWFQLNATPIEKLTNRTSCSVPWLFNAQNIDVHKSTNLMLIKKLETQIAMLDASLDCIKVINPDGTLLDMNKAGCEALGVPINSDFGMDWLGLLPQDIHAVGHVALATAREGKIGRFPGRSEMPGQTPHHWDNILTPVINDEGETDVILCLSRDITVQHELENALRLSNLELETKVNTRTAELNTLWNTSLELLLILDTDGNIIRANPAWETTLGYATQELIHKPLHFFAVSEDVSRCETLLKTTVGTAQPIEIRYLHKNGTLHWVSWIAVQAENEIYVAGRDITTIKETEEKLRITREALHHAQKVEALGNFIGTTAHDFNNLLSIMRNSLSLISLPNRTEEQRARYMQVLSSTTDKAISMSRQLLDFARRSPSNPEVFCATHRLENLEMMMSMICGQHTNIQIQGRENPCHVMADPCQFDAAIVNLVTNAAHAMQGKGNLIISVSQTSTAHASLRRQVIEGNFVAIAISDTGEGIAPALLGQIFEPFFTTKKAGVGTGLGLSQVFGFAEQSGGCVGVESVLGSGTTITIYLPHVVNS